MAFDKAETLSGRSAAGLMSSATPEDAFLAWVLWLPAGADIAECARMEIARIDGGDVTDARSMRLRDLLAAAAGSAGLAN